MAPRCWAARSTGKNSTRLVIISATVSPRLTPSPARPAARRRTSSARARQVTVRVAPTVRRATVSGATAAVRWKASQSVADMGVGSVMDQFPSIGSYRNSRSTGPTRTHGYGGAGKAAA